ncbi:LOW QUALITY PROTEIN: matrix Gla protein-like [Podargus strigoides]
MPGELPPQTRAAGWWGSDGLRSQASGKGHEFGIESTTSLGARRYGSSRSLAALSGKSGTEREIPPCTGTIRTLIILTFLAVLVMAVTCYESHESMESHEYLNPFTNRRWANDFIADTRLGAISQERIRERIKSPQERQREVCEDYYPCELYAFCHGYAAAYRHYFGRRRTK